VIGYYIPHLKRQFKKLTPKEFHFFSYFLIIEEERGLVGSNPAFRSNDQQKPFFKEENKAVFSLRIPFFGVYEGNSLKDQSVPLEPKIGFPTTSIKIIGNRMVSSSKKKFLQVKTSTISKREDDIEKLKR
jgi:hypothetical protein